MPISAMKATFIFQWLENPPTIAELYSGTSSYRGQNQSTACINPPTMLNFSGK